MVTKARQNPGYYYGFLFAVLSFTWWMAGMVYTLGHTVFTGLLPQPVYNVLSYPIAGPFLFVSEHLLSGHIHLLYHLVLVIILGFGTGTAYGLLKKSRLK